MDVLDHYYSSVSFLVSIFFLRETNAAVLLGRKAARLCKETGNTALVSKMDRGLTPRQLFLRAIVCLTKFLLLSLIMLLLSLLCAFVFSLLFMLFTTFPTVFEEQYQFLTGVSGLSYLGVGIGMAVSLAVFASVSDKLHKALGDSPTPEGRLKTMAWVMPAVPVGIFWYGWAAETQTHWIVPILGTSLFGFGILWAIMPTQLLSGGCVWAGGCGLCVSCKCGSATSFCGVYSVGGTLVVCGVRTWVGK
ncbi:hypothetical protein BJX70DRAFT_395801 [Aspergillus crustosus]